MIIEQIAINVLASLSFFIIYISPLAWGKSYIIIRTS